MAQKVANLEQLRTDLQACLAQYTDDPEGVLNEIWPQVIEALDFAAFRQRPRNGQGAMLVDPLAGKTATEIEALMQQRAANDASRDEDLARSQGKWARDGA
ncbi:MAG: hypothetical protein IT324_34210 [Anaerolineae bacterium]|nr:hypothetical protein [Anaerolineae bacterium]